MASPNFAGTIILDKSGDWWIAWSFHGVYLVQGNLAETKAWSQKKFGKSVQFPGTSVNINPASGAGFGGSSTAIIFGPFPSKNEAVKEATTGQYAKNVSASGNESSVTGGLPFNLGNLVLRVGEVALGVVLVGIALNALLKNPVGKTVSTAAKAAR